MTKKKNAASGDLALPDRCGRAVAHQIVAAGAALPPGGRLCIGAAAVQRMSCAAAIALISVAKTIAPEGGKIVIRAPSATFTDAFADLGLFESLMKMEFAE